MKETEKQPVQWGGQGAAKTIEPGSLSLSLAFLPQDLSPPAVSGTSEKLQLNTDIGSAFFNSPNSKYTQGNHM